MQKAEPSLPVCRSLDLLILAGQSGRKMIFERLQNNELKYNKPHRAMEK
jgi:hypothetical protein